MNIGIDFDNTIVKYDSLFKKVAHVEGIILENWNDQGKKVWEVIFWGIINSRN